MSGADTSRVVPLSPPFPRDVRVALRTIEAFDLADTLDILWDTLVHYAKAIGADLLSYHHHAPDFTPDHENMSMRTYGFPQDWVETYQTEELHRIDPIAQIFTYRIRPVRWSRIDTLIPLTKEQTAYLARLRSWLTGDGIGLPAFGPSGRHGYVGIGRKTDPLDDWDLLQTNRLHWVVESFHLRWCELVLLNLPHDFKLGDRELLILESMALGMSDEIICGVVGATLDSVRSSIRSILKKMGVSDRPSAILRGVGAGVLDPKSSIIQAR